MRRLINYIRSCFCKHEWELLSVHNVWDQDKVTYKYPIGRKWTYRCKKCGFFQVYRNYD